MRSAFKGFGPAFTFFICAALPAPVIAEGSEGAEAFTEFARVSAHVIETAEPNGRCDDLGFLGELTENIDVIGLGEARHDGHEFFQMKRRLIECLVTEQGFTHIVMEEGLPYAEHLNRYLLTGEGNLLSLTNGMGAWFIWDTDEFIALMRWLRTYNADRGYQEQVQFHGMDITDPIHGIEATLDFLERIDPDFVSSLGNRVSLTDVYRAPMWPTIMRRYGEMSGTDLATLGDVWRTIRRALDDNEAQYKAKSGKEEYEWISMQFRNVEQAHEMFSALRTDYTEGGMIRERAMTENLVWVVDQASDDDRFMVWSHNFHIAKASFDLDIPNRPRARLTPMGVDVAKAKNLRYLAVGLSFYEGVEPWGLLASAPDTLDSALAATSHRSFLIDLRKLKTGSDAKEWARDRQVMRGQGGTAALAPSESFDALLFIHTLDKTQLSEAARTKFSALQ